MKSLTRFEVTFLKTVGVSITSSSFSLLQLGSWSTKDEGENNLSSKQISSELFMKNAKRTMCKILKSHKEQWEQG